MINTFKKLFGIGPDTNYKELMEKGATILDVRTKAEFQSGHIRGAVNIPLNNLQSQIKKLNKHNPIITCCASGMRSAQAKSILKSAGFVEVHNGGGWSSLQGKM